jgi:hypothetical protein
MVGLISCDWLAGKFRAEAGTWQLLSLDDGTAKVGASRRSGMNDRASMASYVENQSGFGPVSNKFQAEERFMPSLKNRCLLVSLVKSLRKGGNNLNTDAQLGEYKYADYI